MIYETIVSMREAARMMGALAAQLEELLAKHSEWTNEIRIEELELDTRSYHCLINRNIRTIGELVSTSASDLLKMKNFGPKSLRALEQVLAEKGYSLRV